MRIDLSGESHLNSDEGIVAFVGHGLEVAGYSAIGVGESLFTKAPGDLLLDLAHSQIAFSAVVCEGDVRQLCKEQDGGFMPFETFPEVVSVRLGDASSLAVFAWVEWVEVPFRPESGYCDSVFGDFCIHRGSVFLFLRFATMTQFFL